MNTNEIVKEVKRVSRSLIADRRYLHQHPELSGSEKNTARYIAARLKKLGISCTTGVGGHGVVGLITGAHSGKCLGIRADMDALPLVEASGVRFISKNKGVMHACGHDAHMAMVLAAANILQRRRSLLKGKVKLIFQPSEEKPSGGALQMINDDVLKNPKVDMILALHIAPYIATGRVGVIDGPAMAQVVNFKITIKGKGAHGAGPHSAVDPIVTAAQAVTALQTIVSRKVNPLERAVLTIGSIHGGEVNNIIPDSVFLTGTVRTFDKAVARVVNREMKRILKGVTSAAGATYELDVTESCTSLHNHKRVNGYIRQAVRELWGARALMELPAPSTGGEDFAYFTEKVPGAMFRLGCGSAKIKNQILHNHQFTLDEDALPYGVAVYVHAAASYLAV